MDKMQIMENVSMEKLRGGFYTPQKIINFILEWSLNGNNKYDILEPGCGDGRFLEQIKKVGYKYNSITAVEIIEEEAIKANEIVRDLPNALVLHKDFLEYCNETKDRFDLIVGNPPYIRYQFINEEQQENAEKLFKRAGLKYSKLTNMWAIFVVGSCLLLKEQGKMGFVLPAELLQVSFAKPLRKFLSRYFNKINIISFKKLVFPGIQQEVILLLCEKNGSKIHKIEHLEINDEDKLKDLNVNRLKSPQKKIDFKSNKWTFYFLEQHEIDFIEELLHSSQIQTLGCYANVEVGMTTGDNKFFTVPLSTVEKYNLHEYAKPMVGRSVQVLGAIFKESDWKKNIDNGARAFFLEFPEIRHIQNNNVLEYLKKGMEMGVHKRYKCKIRDEWQIVPSVWSPQALFIRRNNIYPKLILNEVGAYTTDTMHRVTVKAHYNLEAFIASYYNSLSLAFTEICGRSHGGGALELMPNEVEEILLPYRKDNDMLLYEIDEALRKNENIDTLLKLTDKIILKDGYGFTEQEIKMANNIWKKLLNRRINRKY